MLFAYLKGFYKRRVPHCALAYLSRESRTGRPVESSAVLANLAKIVARFARSGPPSLGGMRWAKRVPSESPRGGP
jgi:hypothetical protein